MRLITHTDLDGVMCGVLISVVEQVDDMKFVDPGTMQAGRLSITEHDIIADLPFDRRCGLWFDHHVSSAPPEGRKFEGLFRAAPSAARVVFEYYENPYLDKYKEALEAVDKIDSGRVAREEAENPTGWFLLSNTLESSAEKKEDDEYKRHVIGLVRKNPDIDSVLRDEWVAERAANVRAGLEQFREILLAHTVMIGKVAFSDLRACPELPKGNNYVVYSLFPDAVTSVRLMPEKNDKDSVKISVGHNIYGKMGISHGQNASGIGQGPMLKSGFDVGAAMKRIGGGGHKPVGGATVKKEEAEAIAKKIIEEINKFEEN